MIVTRNILQKYINPDPLLNPNIYDLEPQTRDDSLIKVNNSLINFIEFNLFIHPDDKTDLTFFNPKLVIETDKFKYEIDNLIYYDNRLYRIDFNEYFKRFSAFILFKPSNSTQTERYKNTFTVKINYDVNVDEIKKRLGIPNNIKNLRLIK